MIKLVSCLLASPSEQVSNPMTRLLVSFCHWNVQRSARSSDFAHKCSNRYLSRSRGWRCVCVCVCVCHSTCLRCFALLSRLTLLFLSVFLGARRPTLTAPKGSQKGRKGRKSGVILVQAQDLGSRGVGFPFEGKPIFGAVDTTYFEGCTAHFPSAPVDSGLLSTFFWGGRVPPESQPTQKWMPMFVLHGNPLI